MTDTLEIDRLAEAVAWLKSGEAMMGPRTEAAVSVVLDRLASMIPAGGLAEEALGVPSEIPTLSEKPAYVASTQGRSDPLYAMACQVVRASKRGSISLVQRHLRIGYNRAAGLLEAMVGDVIAEMPPTTKIIKVSAALSAPTPQQEQPR